MDAFGYRPPGLEANGPRGRRWSAQRLRRAVGWSLAILGVLGAVVLGVPGQVAGWVAARPEYRWTAEGITLSPAPPLWIRGGAPGLIRRAGLTLESYEGGSALALEPAAVGRAFKKLEWIERIERVELDFPARTVVGARYRMPVVVIRGTEGVAPLYLDEHAVVLPGAEVDEEALPALLGVLGLGRPVDTNAGASWSSDPTAADPDARALSATRTGAFVAERVQTRGWPLDRDGHPWRLTRIHLGNGPTPSIAFQATDGTWIRWEPADGVEDPDRPGPAERWRMIEEWVARERPGAVDPDRLMDFGRHGVAWLQGTRNARDP